MRQKVRVSELSKLLSALIKFFKKDFRITNGMSYRAMYVRYQKLSGINIDYSDENRRSLFREGTQRRTIDIVGAIGDLIEKKRYIVAYSLTRTLFEMYLQTRFVVDVDSISCYHSFLLFTDFQSAERLAEIESKHFSDKEDRKMLQTVLELHKQNGSIQSYKNCTAKFISEFNLKHPNNDLKLDVTSDGWWCRLTPGKLSSYFGGDILEHYKKKYWYISNLTHPSPGGNLVYTGTKQKTRKSLGEESLAYAIIFSARIWQKINKDKPPVVRELELRLKSLAKFYN